MYVSLPSEVILLLRNFAVLKVSFSSNITPEEPNIYLASQALSMRVVNSCVVCEKSYVKGEKIEMKAYVE